MPDIKKYIDFAGLSYYDSKLKTWVTDLVNSHTPSVDAIQSIKAGQTELPVEEGTVTLSSVAGTGSYDDLKDKPFEEVSSEFPLVSVHFADGEGHEGEIENNDITNAVYTATPADNLIYVGESTGWPETEFDHIIWDDSPDTTAEGRFPSMYFYGPTLDMSGYVNTLKEFKSQKLEVTYNGTSYSLPLISEYDGVPEYESDETSFFAGQHQYQSSEYVFEYPFRVEIIIGTTYNEETGKDDLDFSHVFFTPYLLCNRPFDISIGFSNKQIIKIDNKYINTAQSISDGETGLVTGDQVYDYVQENIAGAVSGPSSSVNGHLAVFDGTSGKVLKDGGIVPDLWDFRVSYNRSSSKVAFSQVKKNGELFNGNLSAYAITVADNGYTNMMSIAANKTFTNGGYNVILTQSGINFLSNADTLIFKLGSPDGSKVYEASFTVPLTAPSIADGAHGFTTGDQVYDYVQSVAAQSISDGETGYTTGDQVYDATLVKTSRETQLSPNEIVDFVEIKPTSTYSSSVITDYTEE